MNEQPHATPVPVPVPPSGYRIASTYYTLLLCINNARRCINCQSITLRISFQIIRRSAAGTRPGSAGYLMDQRQHQHQRQNLRQRQDKVISLSFSLSDVIFTLPSSSISPLSPARRSARRPTANAINARKLNRHAEMKTASLRRAR